MTYVTVGILEVCISVAGWRVTMIQQLPHLAREFVLMPTIIVIQKRDELTGGVPETMIAHEAWTTRMRYYIVLDGRLGCSDDISRSGVSPILDNDNLHRCIGLVSNRVESFSEPIGTPVRGDDD
jgi:hypothetical protein